jgi:hypothetical protein
MLYEIYHVASFSMLQLFYLMSQQPYLHVAYVFAMYFHFTHLHRMLEC